jgi:hypothetical protein
MKTLSILTSFKKEGCMKFEEALFLAEKYGRNKVQRILTAIQERIITPGEAVEILNGKDVVFSR